MDATLALNLHSILPHRAHSHSLPQEKSLATCNPNFHFTALRRELPREPASGHAEALSADSVRLSGPDRIGAENQPHNFTAQCTSKASAFTPNSTQKAVDTFFWVFGASNC